MAALPRLGQPAAQVQDQLLRLRRRLRAAAHQLRRHRGRRPPTARRRRGAGFSRRDRRRHGLEGVCRPAALLVRAAGADHRRMPGGRPAVPRLRRSPDSHVRPAEVRRPPAGNRPLPRVGRRISRPGGSRPQRFRVAADRVSRRDVRRSPPALSPTRGAATGWPSSRSRSPRASFSPIIWPRSPSWRRFSATSTSTAPTGRISNCTASRPQRLPQLRAEIQALGLETEDFFGLSDVVSCVGTTYCPLAVSTTHTMFDLLARSGPRSEICVDSRPGIGEHHRLPQFVLPLPHCRHRPARAAHPRETGLDRRLPDHRRRHAATVRRGRGRVQAGRLRPRGGDDSRHVPAAFAAAKKPWPTMSPGWASSRTAGPSRRWRSATRRPSIRWNCRWSRGGAKRRATSRPSPATFPAARPVRPARTCPSTSATSPTAGRPKPIW